MPVSGLESDRAPTPDFAKHERWAIRLVEELTSLDQAWNCSMPQRCITVVLETDTDAFAYQNPESSSPTTPTPITARETADNSADAVSDSANVQQEFEPV